MSTPTADFQMDFEDSQQAEADKKLLVKFSIQPTHCEFASIEAGRPIYRDEEVVEIMFPGSRTVSAAIVTDEHKRRFPRQYAAFKQGIEQKADGTPLSVLVWLTPSQIMEFAALNCTTVEQLAAMPDQLAQRFMGAHSMKQRAQAYLDAAKDAAPMLKLQAELEKRDDIIANMQKQLDELVAARAAESKAKVPVKA